MNGYDERFIISRFGRLRMGSDGHGIRSLIIVSGCPLRCKECINSFTWDINDNIGEYTAEELYNKICIDRPYILATNGGLTFGGGAPLSLNYPSLIKKMRDIADKNMTFIVETSLNVPKESLQSVLGCVDEFIVDIKTMNSQIYQKYTGGNLETVKENLKFLIKENRENDVLIRIPIIPNYTDAMDQQYSKEVLSEMGFNRFDLFKYTKKG